MHAPPHAHRAENHRLRAALLGTPPVCTTAVAQHAPSGVKADGNVTTSVATIPYSAHASPQARTVFAPQLGAGYSLSHQ